MFKSLHSLVADSVLRVADLTELGEVQDPQAGDVRYVEDPGSLYVYDGSSWSVVAGGVTTPGSSTDNAVVRWDGTSGGAVQNSSVTISDSGAIAGVTLDADSNTITNIENDNIKAGAAIAADKIADGSVSNTEFQYLSGVTSDIQTQLNTNATAISDHLSDTTDAHDASAISNVPSGNLSATDVQAALNELQSDVDTREIAANKGAAGGYASLDGGGKVPVSQLPSSLMTYEGTWSAATNTPTLADGVGDAGMVYIVSAAGTVDFGSGNITFAVGDWAIYNGTVWQQSDNADDVVSVNGFTGTVVLDYDDVNAISEMGAVSDLRLVKTSGTSGGQITQTGITVNGFDQMSGVASLDVDNVRLDGNTVEATTGNLTVTAAGDVIIDAAADSVQIDNAGTLQLRGTGGVPVGLTFYDGDESNYIQVQIPTAVTSNRTPQIPDDSGNFVLTSATQAITNKDIDGGTASDTSRITVPQDTKANLDALTRKEGTIVYANDEDSLYVDNGTDLIAVGSGSGSGEKNYIDNPSGASATTGWSASSANLTITRTTTASELPRENTTGTGLKIVAGAGISVGDYVYYDFDLDDVDINRKLNIKWAQKLVSTYAAGDLTVYIAAQTDRTTAIATPVVSDIPGYDMDFDAQGFDTNSTTAVSLVIKNVSLASGEGVVISDVIVGPGTIQAVPAVGAWQSFTLSGTWVSNATYTGFYRRNNDTMDLDLTVALTGAPTATGLYFNMPTGLTIDSSKLSTTTSAIHKLGDGTIFDNGSYVGYAFATYHTSTQIRMRGQSQSTGAGHEHNDITSTVPHTFASGDRVTVRIYGLPIAEWAAAPNYAYDGSQAVVQTIAIANSNQTLTSVSGYQQVTNFQTIQENVGGGSWSAGRFTVPYAGYYLVTSGIMATGGNWASSTAFVGSYVFVNGSVVAGLAGGAVASTTEEAHRLGSTIVKLNAGDIVDIRIWSSSTYTATINSTGTLHDRFTISRMADQYGRPVVGFGYVTQNSSGLVKRAGQLLGTNTNDSAEAGNVGEYISVASSSATVSSDYVTAATLNFSGYLPGDFDVSASITFSNGITTQTDSRGVALLTAPGVTSVSGHTVAQDYLVFGVFTGSSTTGKSSVITFPTIRAVWDGTNVIFHYNGTTKTISGSSIVIRVYSGVYSAGSATAFGAINARRVR